MSPVLRAVVFCDSDDSGVVKSQANVITNNFSRESM
jgi:hypothetical protein